MHFTCKENKIKILIFQWAIYWIVAIDVWFWREEKDLQKVSFYDPIKNQTYLNVHTILYFLEKETQYRETIQDILKKTEVFKQLCPN